MSFASTAVTKAILPTLLARGARVGEKVVDAEHRFIITSVFIARFIILIKTFIIAIMKDRTIIELDQLDLVTSLAPFQLLTSFVEKQTRHFPLTLVSKAIRNNESRLTSCICVLR